MDPKTPPPTDEKKRKAVADKLAKLALSTVQYDLGQFQKALDEWREVTKKPEEK